MRLLAPLAAALALIAGPSLATTYYVSKSTDNGYTTGADANACTTVGAPCLTIQGAKLKIAAGGVDTIQVNPGVAGANVYAETSGGGNFTFGTLGVLTGDPTQCGTGTGTGNKPTLRRASAGDVLQVTTAAFNQTVACFILDGQSLASSRGYTMNQSSNLLIQQVDFRNFAASGSVSNASTGTSTVVWDRVTTDATVLGGMAYGNDTHNINFSVLGGSYISPNATALFYDFNQLGVVNFGADTNGLLPIIQDTTASTYAVRVNGGTQTRFTAALNCTLAQLGCIYLSAGTIPTVVISGGTYSGTTVQPLQVQNITSSSVTIANNTYTGAQGFLLVGCELCTNVTFGGANSAAGNTINMSAGTRTIKAVQLGTGAGLVVGYNTCNAAASSGNTCFLVSDGMGTDATNTAARTAFQKLNDVAGDTFAAQAWTTTAITSYSRFPYLYGVDAWLSKVGSPTGNITACIEADNAGSPSGTCLATSAAVAVAPLTGSSVQYHFMLTPFSVAAATKFYMVFSDTGAIDASNYVQIDTNGTTTIGSVFTSTTGAAASWKNDATHAFRTNVYTGWYGNNNGVWKFNKCLYADATDTIERECINLGSTQNETVFGTICTNASYCVLGKETLGTSYVYSNLAVAQAGSNTGLYSKASTNMNFLDNTIIVAGTATGAGINANDDLLAGVGNPIFSAGMVAKNNIIKTSASAFPYLVAVDSTGSAIDYNDVNAAGTAINSTGGTLWAAWQAAGNDTHSVQCDPNLPNETTPTVAADITPPEGNSCAIGRGTNLAANAPTDILGASFTATPALGAVMAASTCGAKNLLGVGC
jgi:hypothetical protein